MIIQKLPPSVQKIVHLAVIASAIFLVAITAEAGFRSEKINHDVADKPASECTIQTIDGARP